MSNLACTRSDQGKLNEAASMNKEVLERMRRVLGDKHPNTISAMSNLNDLALKLMVMVYDYRKLTFAVVAGTDPGYGMDLADMCDISVYSENAVFGSTPSEVGNGRLLLWDDAQDGVSASAAHAVKRRADQCEGSGASSPRQLRGRFGAGG